MSATSSTSLGLDSTYGCLFVACVLTTALWGAATVQLYLYYNKYAERDTWRMKSYVLLVWMLDTALQIVDIHSTYTTFVTNFGNLLGLYTYNLESNMPTLLTLLVDALVQFYFLLRAYRLSHGNLLVTGAGLALILGQAALLLVYFAKAYHFTLITQLASLINIEHALNAITAATDIYLAGVLVAYLWGARSKSRASIEEGVRMPRKKQRVESVVEKMIVYALGTGSLTAILAIVALITELATPSSFVYVLLDLLMPNIYLNSMLVALNTRQSFRTELDTPSNSEEIGASEQVSTFHVAQRTDFSTLSAQDMSTVPDSLLIASVSGPEAGKVGKQIPEDSRSNSYDGSDREIVA